MKKKIHKSILGHQMRSRNKFDPHQGEQEKARRIKQRERNDCKN